MPDKQYLLKVKGTYVAEGRTFHFVLHRRISLPPPVSGEDEASTGSAESNVVSDAPFPPDIIVGPPEAEVNPLGPPVPTGPLRGSVTPTSPAAEVLEPEVLEPVEDADLGVFRVKPQQVANPLVFVRNTPFRITGGVPRDPSGASSGNVVLASGNTYASLSTDGGRTFTQLDPTTIFPNRDATGNLIDGGLCCDQVIHYIPSINRFVWLMQFNRARRPMDPAGGAATGPNRLRIAVASPQGIIDSGGTAWTFWDLTSGTFGLGISSALTAGIWGAG